MVERKTIRPITLRRIIEICSLAVQSKGLTVEIVSDKLNSTKSRSKEILLEVEKMGLLNRSGELWIANDYTTYFIKSFEKEEWNKIHQYFLENYQFYKEFIQILKNHINDLNGISIEDIVKESTDSNLHLNKTAVEVLTDWCERLGIIQRNLYTAKIYLIKEGSESLDKFVNTLLKCYRKITLSKW
jgi:predicted transcriptional regulator